MHRQAYLDTNKLDTDEKAKYGSPGGKICSNLNKKYKQYICRLFVYISNNLLLCVHLFYRE